MTTPDPLPRRQPGAVMKLAIDFAPLIIFFLTNSFAPGPKDSRIFVATGAFMVATLVAMLVSRLQSGRISAMLWFSGVMVVVFGGLTLWLHDQTFIMVKPTIYYVVLASILFFGLRTGKPTIELVLGAAYPGLSALGWRLLTRNWAFFFVGMAIANEIVRTRFTDWWVSYKLFGALPATLLFALANMPMLMRHGMAIGDAEAQTPPPQG